MEFSCFKSTEPLWGKVYFLPLMRLGIIYYNWMTLHIYILHQFILSLSQITNSVCHVENCLASAWHIKLEELLMSEVILAILERFIENKNKITF